MSGKIQDGSFIYFFTKVFVDWAVKSSYRKYQVEGLENVPQNASVIWASNHTNALMDPLVMLSATKQQKVFVARADIFKKKPVIKILTFLKIMPIYRIRDGIEAVRHNNESIAQATDVLLDGVPFVIYPEATHRPKHSLLKLSKGIFHIAESAIEHSDESKPVYIQPIGIEYGDYFRFRSTVLIRFGTPIDVTAFMKEHSDLQQPVAMLKLRELLTQSLAGLIAYVPDDEDYDATWEYAKLKADNPHYFKDKVDLIEKRDKVRLRGLMKLQAVDRYAIQEILDLKAQDPESARNLLDKVDALRVWRIQNGVSVTSIAGNRGWLSILFRLLLALLGAPYYFFSGLVSCITWIPLTIILRGITDEAFNNTARFGVRFAMAPLSVILWIVLFFTFLPWKIALVAFVLSLPSLRFIYAYGRFFRRLCSDLRWKIGGGKAPDHSFL